MSALVILEWNRPAGGYKLVKREPDPPRIRRYQHPLLPRQMLEETVPGEERGGVYLVPQGPPKPLLLKGLDHMVCLDLANTECTPESVAGFASRWGLLDDSTGAGDIPVSVLSLLVYDRIQNMRWLIDAAMKRRWKDIERGFERAGGVGAMTVSFKRISGEPRPRICLQPRNLMSFCWTEVMQRIAAGGAFNRCLNCGAFFAPERSTGLYCSPKCRVAQCRKTERAKAKRAETKRRGRR